MNWFETDLGRYVLARERAWFDAVSIDLFGFHALQVGGCDVDYLRANRMPHRFCIASEGGVLACLPEQLPLASQQVDLLALPHVLEFAHDPRAVLREAERVLRPEGRLLIACFNPLSLWGLRRRISPAQAAWPWRGRFIHLTRLKDWLALLGFEMLGGRMACYAPPINRAAWLNRFTCLEAAGDRWWAMGGGIYLIHAVKRVHGVRILDARRNRRWSASPVWAPAPRKTAE